MGVVSFTPSRLRDEGVLEIGRAAGFAFVLTRAGLRLFHVAQLELASRTLDRHALDKAARMLELGYSLTQAGNALGVTWEDLRGQLRLSGWIQQSKRMAGPREGAHERWHNRPRRRRATRPKTAQAAI